MNKGNKSQQKNLPTPPTPNSEKSYYEYKKEDNNSIYQISLQLINDTIAIEVCQRDKLPYVSYKEFLTLKSLIQKDKYFKLCDDLNDALFNFNELFRQKQFKLENENNNINLHFEFEILNKKSNFTITLHEIDFNNDNTIRDLCKKVNSIESDLKELNLKVDNLIKKNDLTE